MSGRTYSYTCFGLTIRSAIALPELERMAAVPAGGLPVVDIRLGTVSAGPFGASGGALQVGNGEALLQIKNTARFLVRAGREIVVDRDHAGAWRDVRLFLLGSAFGLLCHQRGLLPLHANAIVTGGEAVAFAGRTGIGKSTLAAYFQARGYPVLCDDVCVVSFDAVGRPLAWPGLPRLKLWRDAAETFGHDSRNLERAIEGRDKFHVPLREAISGGPYPLSRVYVLRYLAPDQPAAIRRLSASRAVQALMTHTYRRSYLRLMGLVGAGFQRASAIAAQAAVLAAPRHRGFEVFEREAARLEAHLLASGGGDQLHDGPNGRYAAPALEA